ncbi:unnamed protein product, partial [Oppiella nova]
VDGFFLAGGLFRAFLFRGPVRRVRVVRRSGGGGGGNLVNMPPGYKEALFMIAAFCAKSDNCVSDYTQGKLFTCFNKTNGQPAEFTNKFENCVNTRTEGCGKASMKALQNCVEKMSQNPNAVKVPKSNRNCIRSYLTITNLQCLKTKYPGLEKLLPLSSDKPNG